MKANNTYAREPETPKLVAVPSLLAYGVDSRLNHLAKAKTSRISSSGIFFRLQIKQIITPIYNLKCQLKKGPSDLVPHKMQMVPYTTIREKS